MQTSTDNTQCEESQTQINRQKKIAKKLQKRKVKSLRPKIQSLGNHVTLISRDFAECITNSGNKTLKRPSVSAEFIKQDFPSISEGCSSKKIPIVNDKAIEESQSSSCSKKRGTNKLNLFDYVVPENKQSKSIKIKRINNDDNNYCGNYLDSSLPTRKRGKHREIPKPKMKSRLKKDILIEKAANDINENGDCVTEECNYEYCNKNLPESITKLIKYLLIQLVDLQEKLCMRDPLKGKLQRRYVLGFHELKKHLKLNKIKLIIIATDIKVSKPNDVLDTAIKELVADAALKNIPYIFALRRRHLGRLVLKSVPVSCIGIINYHGVEGDFENIKKYINEKQYETEKQHIYEKPVGELRPVMDDIQLSLLTKFKEILLTNETEEGRKKN